MKFRTRYMQNDYSKNYVVMDDETLTEQHGYKTTTELYEEMIRSGKVLAAHRLDMTYDEYLDYEDESPFETRYELDPTEQQEILNEFKFRLQQAEEERLNAEKQNGIGRNATPPTGTEPPTSNETQTQKTEEK